MPYLIVNTTAVSTTPTYHVLISLHIQMWWAPSLCQNITLLAYFSASVYKVESTASL